MSKSLFLYIILCVWIGLLSLVPFSLWRGNVYAKFAQELDEVNQIYLPLVLKKFPPPPPVFGVEINRGAVTQVVDKALEGEFYWVRYNGIVWYEVELNEGQYNWGALDGVESELATLRAKGLEPIVIIRGTPLWAQMDWGKDNKMSYCGPVRQDKLDEFGEFVRAVVSRYSQPPYSVKYWEFGNEPDVDPWLVDLYSPFGCWGNEKDVYYGGGYYANMLQVVYPIVKSIDPSAKVVLGGLLLACDPSNPPSTSHDQCLSAKFLEGFLRNGGGNNFDILAYHAYPSWTSYAPYYVDYDLEFISWRHRGGILLGKLSFLKEVLSRYGYNSKPIMMNEGGLICWGRDPQHPCDLANFYKSQGNYAIRMYTRLLAANVQAVIWYTLNGPAWGNGGMLDGVNPRSPYYTASFLAQKLAKAEFIGRLSTSEYEGYEFYDPTVPKRYRIYWTNKDKTSSIGEIFGLSKAYKFNSQVAPYQFEEVPYNNQVGFDPIFLELYP